MCVPKVRKVFTENYTVELCFTLVMTLPVRGQARFVTCIGLNMFCFFSMQQGMMFFYIGISMAIVQGIINLFHGALRTLWMGMRQNIPVIFALCNSGTSCKYLSLLHPVTTLHPVAILSMIHVQQKLFLGKQTSALSVM